MAAASIALDKAGNLRGGIRANGGVRGKGVVTQKLFLEK